MHVAAQWKNKFVRNSEFRVLQNYLVRFLFCKDYANFIHVRFKRFKYCIASDSQVIRHFSFTTIINRHVGYERTLSAAIYFEKNLCLFRRNGECSQLTCGRSALLRTTTNLTFNQKINCETFQSFILKKCVDKSISRLFFISLLNSFIF